jgi:hypothetical protein
MRDRTLVVLHEGLCSRVTRHYTLGHLGPYMLYIAFNWSENIHIMPPDVKCESFVKCFVTTQRFILGCEMY